MRIIIEVDPAAQVATISQAGVSSSADASGPAVDAGPPAIGDARTSTSADSLWAGAKDLGGPPADLIAEIEAARAKDAPKGVRSATRPS